MHLLPYGSMLIEVADKTSPSGVWRGVSLPLDASSMLDANNGMASVPAGSLTLGSSSQDQANLVEQEPAVVEEAVTTTALAPATTVAFVPTTGAFTGTPTGPPPTTFPPPTGTPLEGSTTAAAAADPAISADAGVADPGLAAAETTAGPAAAEAHAYRAVSPGIAVPMCVVAVYMAATTVNKER